MPGTIYEISSSLEVYAKSGPGSGALSSFANSFTVELSGIEIPSHPRCYWWFRARCFCVFAGSES